ncbi:DsbA family protein [Pseudidiomarina donghaiensis]|uniref:Protein-disulfide isomerase n=1 Tax=Pseudidiomarina donghaiensis TaxID=519452 RepID=A0A432XIE1_9GAMM|nr:DsbA family protein [Pseudidiomarina donghaiensis]RUO48357.1 protein-disulfide isomerase [Pseudidiomarina donghaiensis]SFV24315.1 Protein-disulfide isomerase [Pseudidiomarina donghaiensis]
MKFLVSVFLSISLSFAVATSVKAQQKSTEQASQLQEIEALLQQNPEIIPSVLDSLKSYIENKAAAQKRSAEHGPWLFENDETHPWFGAKESALEVVVFTDYDCPYCKRLEPHLQKLVSEYEQLKVINIMIPLRQGEVEGGKLNPAAYALNVWQNQPKQFADVHELLYAKNGLHTQKSLEQIARRTGTRSQLQSENATPTIISRNYQVFRDFGLNGTPAMIIGGRIIPGYVEYADLEKVVIEALQQAPSN